jgi:hypothetical protein
MPGGFETGMGRQLTDANRGRNDARTFASHLPAVYVGPKHKRAEMCRGLRYSGQKKVLKWC